MMTKPCDCEKRQVRGFLRLRLPSLRFWKRFLLAVAAVFLALSLAGEFVATQLSVFLPSLGIEPRGDMLGNILRALASIFGVGM